MQLHQSPSSPYVRKVRMALSVCGLSDKVTMLTTDTTNQSDTLHAANPLGKIPTLERDDGKPLYDSRVICEYIDSIGTTGVVLFPKGDDKWPVLTLQALADGICDAALLIVYEQRYRPEEVWYQPWMQMQQTRIDNALVELEASIPPADNAPNIGTLATIAALGYLDLRLDGKWRKDHPKLDAWFEQFAASNPCVGETAPA